jgi:hypothetical protein
MEEFNEYDRPFSLPERQRIAVIVTCKKAQIIYSTLGPRKAAEWLRARQVPLSTALWWLLGRRMQA